MSEGARRHEHSFTALSLPLAEFLPGRALAPRRRTWHRPVPRAGSLLDLVECPLLFLVRHVPLLAALQLV
eukprot:m.169240 g.169240  ORF g.169240 m.169240 type:complete len:70 (+) comp9917_c1_seq1:59-268(+)